MNYIRYAVVRAYGPYYEAELRLREEVLRKPLGMLLTPDRSMEESSFHLLALDGETVAGVLLLTPLPDGGARLRQAAVRASFRGRGIGGRLVRLAEELAADTGITGIVLHARKEAEGFYERAGYVPEGDEFTEVGIPHRLMVKRL